MGMFNSDHERRLQNIEKSLTQTADILANFKIMLEVQSTKIDLVKEMTERLSEMAKQLQDEWVQGQKKYIEVNKAVSDLALIVDQHLAKHN